MTVPKPETPSGTPPPTTLRCARSCRRKHHRSATAPRGVEIARKPPWIAARAFVAELQTKVDEQALHDADVTASTAAAFQGGSQQGHHAETDAAR